MSANDFTDRYRKSDQALALDASEVQELSNLDSRASDFPYRSRKKIMYNAKLAAQMRREQLLTMRSDKKVKAVNDMDVLNTTYKENKVPFIYYVSTCRGHSVLN